jgi:hypothetical protein
VDVQQVAVKDASDLLAPAMLIPSIRQSSALSATLVVVGW